MELRSFNVERVYQACVICSIGEDLGIKKLPFEENKENIVSMLQQVQTQDGKAPLQVCNLRKDGETWTPYLQIVEMLMRMGRKMGVVEYSGRLNADTIITIKV